jgi:dihydrofolate reductase
MRAIRSFVPSIRELPRVTKKGGVPVILVAACTESGGIGFQRRLPWDIPTDLEFFNKVSRLTHDPSLMNALVMGRVSWETMPHEVGPTKQRLDVVLTRMDSAVARQ